MIDLSPADIQKIETGVRVLRESLRPFGLGVELVCQAMQAGTNGRMIHYACDVVEPYGWAPEAACPLHDNWDET